MPDKIYMGGVCGMGMAPLALFSKDCGMDVCGFDDHASVRVAAMLARNGIPVDDSFDAQKAAEADAFVISSALKLRVGSDISAGLNPVRRGRFLADRICRDRRLTAVVGSHGKSTVTAMLAHAVLKTGAEAGYIVGAVPTGFSPSKYCPQGYPLFAEIDESDGTIENFSPEVTLALNADLDHIDQYADSSELAKMFERLFSRTRRRVIILAGDEILLEAARRSGKPYTLVEAADDFTSTNARLAAAAFRETMSLKEPLGCQIFSNFRGVIRRQERLGNIASLEVYADYAHHPNEIKAFLSWLKARFPNRIVVFQPHRYTRTKRFAREFADILSGQDCPVYVAPVYAASEPFDPDGTSAEILKFSKGVRQLESFEEFDVLTKKLAMEAAGGAPKRVLAIVGAGDLYFETKKILEL